MSFRSIDRSKAAARAFFRARGARLFLLGYLLAATRAALDLSDPWLLSFLLIAAATVLGVLSARALALLAVASLLGAATTYVPAKIDVAEQFTQFTYYLLLLLLGRQLAVMLLDAVAGPRGRLSGSVERLEETHTRLWRTVARDVRTLFPRTVVHFEEQHARLWRAVARDIRALLAVVRRALVSVLRDVTHGVRALFAAARNAALAADGGLGTFLRRCAWHSQKLPVSWFVLWLLFLLVIPFFWFRNGEGDFGGDSSRLYFLDPAAWLSTQALHEIGTDGFGNDNPTYFTIPFLVFLRGIKFLVLNRATMVLPLFDGLLLMMAFLSTYGALRELLLPYERDAHLRRTACFVGAAFFVFSQIVMYQWQRYLYTFHQIAVYPVLVWLVLRYLRRPRALWVLLAVLWTFLFSINFSAFSAPGFFAFFPFVGVILLVTAWTRGMLRALLRGAALFLALAIPLHAFHLFPQVVSLFNPQNALLQNLVTAEGKYERGLEYFRSVRPTVRLLYNLVGFTQYRLYTETGSAPELLRLLSTYGIKFLPIFLVFPALVLAGVVKARGDPDRRFRVVFLSTAVVFVISLFLMTANLFGSFGPALYARLFSIPGFSMFRSFYGVFSLSFAFLYALTIGLSLRVVLRSSRSSLRALTVLGLLLPLLYGALPFLTGRIVNAVLADTIDVKVSSRFSPAFESVVRWVRATSLDAKFLTLPLTNYAYQIIDGDPSGAYIGASPFGLLGGKHVFSGLSAFGPAGAATLSYENAIALFGQDDPRVVRRLLATLNIGFVFLNTNPAIYRDRFTGWPYSKETWNLFPTTGDVQRFVDRLGYSRVLATSTYEVYQAPPDVFLPHAYIPREVREAKTPANLFGILLNNPKGERRMAVVFNPSADTSALLNEPHDSSPSLEWKKTSSSDYVLVVHGIRGRTPIVFSELFHRGWRLFPRQVDAQKCGGTFPESGTSAQLGRADHADIEQWCARGLLSATGPDFISQNFADSIQNQNLPVEQSWKRWRAAAVDERYHARVNDYANLWWLDLAYLKQRFPSALRERPDGTYDLTLALEFTPERSFFVGAAVTGMTLLGILCALGVTVLRVRRERFG